VRAVGAPPFQVDQRGREREMQDGICSPVDESPPLLPSRAGLQCETKQEERERERERERGETKRGSRPWTLANSRIVMNWSNTTWITESEIHPPGLSLPPSLASSLLLASLVSIYPSYISLLLRLASLQPAAHPSKWTRRWHLRTF
jgi:hypothetical protein